MTMTEWAENEIKLACKNENPEWDGKSFDYGCAIYQSVLKAYKSLTEDGHSGFSWSMATQILYRLMLDLPLMPITDEDFKGVDSFVEQDATWLKEKGLKGSIQCPRMSSLFKDEHLDGTITYSDNSRIICYDIKEPDMTFYRGTAKEIVDKLFPITLPYYPSAKKYKVAMDGDKILSITTPDGKEINYDNVRMVYHPLNY